jgi:hypothetical protein
LTALSVLPLYFCRTVRMEKKLLRHAHGGPSGG